MITLSSRDASEVIIHSILNDKPLKSKSKKSGSRVISTGNITFLLPLELIPTAIFLVRNNSNTKFHEKRLFKTLHVILDGGAIK